MSIRAVAPVLAFAAAMLAYGDGGNHAATSAEFGSKMFSGAEQYSNFYRMDELFPVHRVEKSSRPAEWPLGKSIELPERYSFDGKSLSTQKLLEETETAAVLVIKDGKIRYENYWLTGGKDQHWISWSVAKSIVSALYGVAIADGVIDSVEDPATKYLPILKGSAYDGVRLKDILQMSSGAYWNEDYANPESEIMRLSRARAEGSFLEFVSTVKRELEPGTFNRYNSADTLVLGLVLEAATGKPLAEYTKEKLWEPLGATNDSYWIVDKAGSAMAYGGFNATARDYARVGELFRLNGKFNGKRILPAGWIKDSVTPDAPHLVPGKRSNSDSPMGYGYQWWLPEGSNKGDYSAIGVYNQFIYISPEEDTVIVKLSAWRDYGLTADESSWRERETIELFRAIAESID